MSKFEEVSTDALLIDFRETEQWLRDYPEAQPATSSRTRTAVAGASCLTAGSILTRSR